MTTRDLSAQGFGDWHRFNPAAKRELSAKLPLGPGVYVIRTTDQAMLKSGATDIVYIGSACNQNGLKGRLAQYFSPGPTQSTNKRILSLIQSSDDFEVGWRELPKKCKGT